VLKKFYENQFFSISTIGIGISLNDLPMSLAGEHPVFLKDSNSPEIPFKNILQVEGTGPQAWNEAFLSIVSKIKI